MNIGDVVIIVSYALIDKEVASKYKPVIIFPDEKSNLMN